MDAHTSPFLAACARNAEKILFVAESQDGQSSLTGAKLGEQVARLSGALQRIAGPGDRVLLLLPQGLEYVVGLLACFHANVVAVPIAIQDPAAEKIAERLAPLVEDARPSGVLTNAAFAASLAKEQPLSDLLVLDIDEEIARSAAVGAPRSCAADDLALLLYTSGSTTQPKGIALTHSHVAAQAGAGAQQWDVSAASRIVSWMPQFHNFGLYFGVLAPLLAGAASVLLPPACFVKSPESWLRAIERHKATHTAAPNFAFDLCAAAIHDETLSKTALSSLVAVICGGEPVSRDVFERFAAATRRFGFLANAFCPHYGLSEVGSVVTKVPGERVRFRSLDLASLQTGRVRRARAKRPRTAVACCGRIPEATAVRVVKPATTQPCAPGEIGEICVRSRSVAQGYFRRSAATGDAFGVTIDGEEGFLRTGDLGFLDDRSLYVVGREKEVMIVHGKNHHPIDVEWTIRKEVPDLSLPLVVFSYGAENEERIAAVQEAEAATSDTYKELARKMLAAASATHGLEISEIAFVAPGAIPRTGSGKVRRKECRDRYLRGELRENHRYVRERRAVADKIGVATRGGDASLERMLRDRVLAAVLDHDPAYMNDAQTLSELGLNSIQYVRIAKRIEEVFGIAFEPVMLFKHRRIDQLAAYLGTRVKAPAAERTSNTALGDPGDDESTAGAVAVVGLSCHFPGGAAGPDAFWRILRDGKDCIEQIADARPSLLRDVQRYGLTIDDAFPPWGGFVRDVDAFDADFFRVSRIEAESMDPQQRKLLELTWSVIESAGYAPSRLAGERIGLFVGAHTNDYAELLAQQPALAAIYGAYLDSGTHPSLIANRVSRWFDFNGPSEIVNTACSSSLVALHRAVDSIASGESRAAIVAGINLILGPRIFIASHKAGMLAADGRCKTFDEHADGFVRAEGYGALLLKPYRQALMDGDSIHGVIRSAVVNHDGQSNSLRAPNVEAQKDLIRSAYEKAAVPLRTITYLETHGTGTSLGDPIEIQALKEAFAELDSGLHSESCGLGTVKTNVGHCESAAGIAGVIKVLLAMRHGTLPAVLHFKRLNRYITLDDSPFYVVERTTPWTRLRDGSGEEVPRRAGVSSFGFGGVNAHVVIEEHVERETRTLAAPSPCLMLLSAKTEERLREQVHGLLAAVEDSNPSEGELPDIAYTLQVGREPMESRLAFAVSSTSELRGRLHRCLQSAGLDAGVHRGVVARGATADRDAQQATAEALLERGEHEEVLRRWVHGWNLDWQALYRPAGVYGKRRWRRRLLPTYPFAKERYWFEARHIEAPSVRAAAPVLHPLLHRNISTLERQRFSVTLDGREPILRDHVVHGERVLPAAGILEMLHAALVCASESLAEEGGAGGFVLRDVVWQRPVTAPVTLHVELSPQPDGSVACEICDGADREARTYASARAVRQEEPRPVSMGLAALEGRATATTTAKTLYERFEATGLSYGATYRAIRELERGADEQGLPLVWARVELPSQAADARYALHPSLVDAALQATFELQAVESDATSHAAIPFALDAICMWSKLPSRVFVLARGARDGATDRFDIDICGDGGEVLARLRGLALRRYEPERTETLLFTPHWTPIALAHERAPFAVDRHWVFLGEGCDADLDAQIENAIPGVHCKRLTSRPHATSDERFVAAAERLRSILSDLLVRSPPQTVLFQLIVPSEDDMLAALEGMLRTAVLEDPRLVVQVIFPPAHSAARQAEVIAAEAAEATTRVVRYDGGQRKVREYREVDVGPVPSTGALWRDEGVYLVTGGLGALGRLFADEIAACAQAPTLILTGRSTLGEEGEAYLQSLRTAGATVEYHAIDVADAGDAYRLVREIDEKHGRLNGVLHAAGITRDSLLRNKTGAELADVLAPKVYGADNLDRATKDIPLDYFVLFSSISALGNVGQADYAAANAYLDAFAWRRNARVAAGERRGHTLSVNWPYWLQGGMRIDPALLDEQHARLGLVPLPRRAGMDALGHAAHRKLTQVAVLHGDARRLRARFFESHRQPVVAASQPQSSARPSAGEHVAADGRLREQTLQFLTRQLSAALKLPADRVQPETAFEHYGVDSVMVLALTRKLERRFGQLPKTLFFEHQNIAALASYFLANHRSTLSTLLGSHGAPADDPSAAAAPSTRPLRSRPQDFRSCGAQERNEQSQAAAATQIAIVGISGRFPGARNLEELWELLKEGRDCIREVPDTRWNHARYFDAEKGKPGKTYSRWGGFIDGVDEFDPLFFGISPHEAEMMDPQERLFLQCAYETIEDAGYTRESLRELRDTDGAEGQVGVFVGVMYCEYQLYAAQAQSHGQPIVANGTPASIANRVSYFLNIAGPSLAIDTMCSSSLTAIHLACQSLRRGECRAAIAGGVNVSIHPNKYLALAHGRFASSTGRCQSFGEGGDGYVPGEGVGAVLLKPLARAIADGDHIYGIIKGSAINHGGKSTGYTVPNPNAQGSVIAQAIRNAGVDPRAISYVEAHGTGTALGDPIEIAGLTKAFAEHTKDTQYCAIGSIKSNIGHLESAAGVAGLAKILLQMKHHALTPTLHAQTTNPHIDFAQTPFRVQRELTAWEAPRLAGDPARNPPRLAGLSSFGAGGANAHLIVEEYVSREPVLPTRAPTTMLSAMLLLSAKRAEALTEHARNLLCHLSKPERCDTDLPSIAYTLQVGREPMAHRLAFTAASLAEAQGKLQAFLDGRAQRGEIADCWCGEAARDKDALAILNADEDMARTVAAWLAKGKHGKLLELWVRGLAIDWRSLGEEPGALRPRRISLPTYPFARERYWLPWREEESRRAAAQERLHPLVHRNVSSLREQRYRSTFTGGEFFLQDHVVRGERTLPGAVQLEMARAAIEMALDDAGALADRFVRLDNVAFLRPVVVAAEPLEIDVALEPRDEGMVEYRILSRHANGERLCGTGRACVAPKHASVTLDLSQLRTCCTIGDISADECYAILAREAIVLGPAFRCLQSVSIGTHEALAKVALPASAERSPSFEIHPCLLDAAFQTCGLLQHFESGGREDGAPRLLFGIEALEAFGGDCGELYVWTRRSSAERFDIDLCDPQGVVRAQLRGVASKPASVARSSSATGGRTGNIALWPTWSAYAPEWLPPRGTAHASVLMLGGDDAQHRVLRDVQRGRVCAIALDGAETVESLAANIAATGDVAHVLWIVPPGDTALDDDAVIGAQVHGVLTGFRLIKALLAAGYGERSLQLTVLTQNAQGIHSADCSRPAHASVHGLIGSLAKEYPRWNVRLVDLPADEEWPWERLFDLPWNANGDAVAYRTGAWYRQDLIEIELAKPDAPSFRERGVYVLIGGAGTIGEALSGYLIREYRAQVVWIGRRAENDDISAQRARLSALGPAPLYISADATDRVSLQGALDAARERFGTIHGVVHAAVSMAGNELAHMDEATFAAGLAAKIDIAVRLAQVCGQMPLDVLLFFSSIQTFEKSRRHSSYASGCTFIDAYATALQGAVRCPVRVVNWGYWEGGVAQLESFRRWLDSVGMGLIEAHDGARFLERMLAAPMNRLAYLNVSKPQAAAALGASELEVLTVARALPNPCVCERQAPPFPLDERRAHRASMLDTLLVRLLQVQVQEAGIDIERGANAAASARGPTFDRWLAETERLLRTHADAVPIGADDARRAWAEWEALTAQAASDAALSARVVLVDRTLRALPDILMGHKSATEVLFPNASMHLVESVYKTNPFSAWFNEVLAESVVGYVEARLRIAPDARLRLFEIGAGTGATSALLLSRLAPYAQHIVEYCYTDVSQAFLQHAEEHYRPAAPYLTTRLFDVEHSLDAQGIASGQYDIVIAANVLHATKNMRATVRNAKALLGRHGRLFINELTAKSVFAHLTFGLLDGWWRCEDDALRLRGSPLLASDRWRVLLASEGFDDIGFPARTVEAFGQQVIVARSDGIVRQPRGSRIERTSSMQDRPALARRRDAAVLHAAAIDAAPTLPGLEERVRNVVAEQLARSLKIDPQRIDVDEPFAEYGVDSITGIRVIESINAALSCELSVTSIFDHASVGKLVAHLMSEHRAAIEGTIAAAGLGDDQVRTDRTADGPSAATRISSPMRFARATTRERVNAESPLPEPVAVIGMSGRFAVADNVEALWCSIADGVELIEDVKRWDLSAYGGDGPACRRGGFLRDVDRFDSLFFNISGAEALYMDPQQRLFLEEAWKALEDAGYAGAATQGKRCGVYVGYNGSDYARLFDTAPAQAMWGNAASIVSARIAYCLDLHGPAVTVDTACSSSLTALHFACRGLQARETDMALAGGVFVQSTPEFYFAASRAGMLSPSGRCYAFDARADGFVPGEGVGVVVLKRLRDALADGDNICGVVRGSAINQDGATNGITAPSARSQERLERDVYDTFGIDPASIQMVEAHGTGTTLGDPIELQALTRAFRGYTDKKNYCAIGSIKTNVGHTTSASGIAGVIKVLLSLRHRRIPPSLHFATGNPHIDFADSPFYVSTALHDWSVPQGVARRAAVSSFGMSGTNAHVVIEESPAEIPRSPNKPGHLITLSARTGEQLRQQAERLRHHIDTNGLDCGHASFTLLRGRKHFSHRLACVVRDERELLARLTQWLAQGAAPGVHSSARSSAERTDTSSIAKDIASTAAMPDEHQAALTLAAQRYVRGEASDFPELFEDGGYRRISLPTYPFAKERYWIASDARVAAVAPRASKTTSEGAGAPVSASSSAEAAQTLMTFEEAWREMPLPAAAAAAPKTLVCFLAGHAHRAQFEQTLQAVSPQTTVCFVGDESGAGRESCTGDIVADDEPSYERVLDRIAERHGAVDAILYLWPLESRQYIEDVAPVLRLLKVIAGKRLPYRRLVLAGQACAAEDQARLESWIAIGRSMRFVSAEVGVSVVVEAAGRESAIDFGAWAERLLAELRGETSESALYRQGCRSVCRVRELAMPADAPHPPVFRRGGAYLITGGCGGLGQLFAEFLAQRYGARLLLTGRRPLDAERETQIRKLEALGAQALYVQADVTDVRSMRAALERATSRFGGLNGVLHTAGVERDRSILDKSIAQAREVLAPKVDGTLVLDDVLGDRPLDFLCYFSSSSAVLGDFGWCDYAVANRFLMAHARLRNDRVERGESNGRTVAIGWPLWRDGGMSFRDREQALSYLRLSGLRMLETTEGIALAERLLSSAAAAPLVVAGEPARVRRFFESTVENPIVAPDEGQAQPVVEQTSAPGKGWHSEMKGMSLVERVALDLKDHAGRLLQIPSGELDLHENLGAFGFDSLSLVEFAKRIGAHYDIALAPSILFSHPTLARFAEYLTATHQELLQAFYREAQPPAAFARRQPVLRSSDQTPRAEPIAIVGMSGRFPQARDIDELWRILRSGENVVQEIPAERFDWRDHYGDPAQAPGKTHGKWLGAMPGIDEFDPTFFEISPREAEVMDPRQRLLLQEAWKALEDAGYGDEHIKRQRIGMFVGVEQGDYDAYLDDTAPITGRHEGVLAARLAYFLDLGGPAMAINTACSSGLVAVHQACSSLWANECDAAVAAGVNLLLAPQTFVGMGQAGMLSPDGKCYAFDKRANGLVPGEAVAVVVVKRLSRAREDGDPIYALIEASGINYDGKTNGIAAPSGAAQTRLLRETYERFAIDPRSIDYVVTHGTGTRLGDPVEINALYDAFKPYTDTARFCALTSSKTNLGHTFAASGVVSLIALVQALRHEVIPPSLHCEQESEYIDWAESPFYVNKEARPWPARADGARHGAVSAFGISGTNAHVVVRSYASDAAPASSSPFHLLVLSAKTEAMLHESARNLARFLQATPADLGAVSYTLLAGRHHFEHRCAVVVREAAEAARVLADLVNAKGFANVHVGQARRAFGPQASLEREAEACYAGVRGEEAASRDCLNALADLYCRGHALAWRRLFGDEPPKRLHLPTYPFARERYWAPRRSETARAPQTARTTKQARGASRREAYTQLLDDVLHRSMSTTAAASMARRLLASAEEDSGTT